MTRTGFRRMAMVAWSYALIHVSSLALRTAAAQPLNDHLTNATPVAGIINLIASNVGATAEPGEPAHAGEPAARSVWWRWSPSFQATYSIVTSNSVATNGLPLDTTLAVYTVTGQTRLTRVIANDDTDYGEFGATWSRVVFRAYAGETLIIAVDSIGPSGAIHLNINLAGPIAPPWEAMDLNSETLQSAAFIGQVVLVDFWETICGACIEELPDLVRVQNALRPRGFTFVGLAGDHELRVVQEYVADSAINYPIGMNNPAAEIALFGGPVGYPTKVLLDGDGRIVGRYLGGNTEAYYRGIIEPLLRPGPPVRLNVRRTQGDVRLTWPGWEPGFRVETTADLLNGPWISNTIRPVISNNQYNVTVPASLPAQYFRLAKP